MIFDGFETNRCYMDVVGTPEHKIDLLALLDHRNL